MTETNYTSALSERDHVGVMAFAAITRLALTTDQGAFYTEPRIGRLGVFSDNDVERSLDRITVSLTFYPENLQVTIGWSPDLRLEYHARTSALTMVGGRYWISGAPGLNKRLRMLAKHGAALAVEATENMGTGILVLASPGIFMPYLGKIHSEKACRAGTRTTLRRLH